MTEKKVPFTIGQVLSWKENFPTPFHVYDEVGIVENFKQFTDAFSVLPGFKEYFAVKALPNPHILNILKAQGSGVDCSSMAELLLAEKLSFDGQDIMFSSNDTPDIEFQKALELGAIINLDDISHIAHLEKVGLPSTVCMRFNPGPAREGNVIIGDPKEAKFGFTRNQIFEAIEILKEKGVETFGIHTMVVSNELHEEYLAETARMMFSLAVEVKEKTSVSVSFINLGGGIGIPYQPDQEPVHYEHVASKMKEHYDSIIGTADIGTPSIYLECGRVITGPYGYLVTTVRHIKHTYKDYIGTDGSMANLMRPGMYGAYHHITILGKEDQVAAHTYDVTGSLCENNDKFAIDRKLPEVDQGDILVIHDTGAHGHAMGFNYNGKLRSAELLLQADGSIRQIRRAETYDDHFATLDFSEIN